MTVTFAGRTRKHQRHEHARGIIACPRRQAQEQTPARVSKRPRNSRRRALSPSKRRGLLLGKRAESRAAFEVAVVFRAHEFRKLVDAALLAILGRTAPWHRKRAG